MKTSPELKRRAKQVLKGKYGLCIGSLFVFQFIIAGFVMVLYAAIIFFEFIKFSVAYSGFKEISMLLIFGAVFLFLYLLIICVSGLLTPGLYKIYLNLCTDKPAKMTDLFYAFGNKPLKFLGYYIIAALIGTIFMIPYILVSIVSAITDFMPLMVLLQIFMYVAGLIGIVFVSLYLSQTMLILIESPDKKIFASIKESAHMMNGNKGRLFYIHISFIGMFLLSYLSFGIGYLWVTPYNMCTITEFYLDLKASRVQQSYADNRDDSYESMLQQENWQ